MEHDPSAGQAVPSGAGTAPHEREASLHSIEEHVGAVIPQSFFFPPLQVPCSHASSTVQNRPSSQGVPPGLGMTVQWLVEASQTEVQQGGVFISEQSSAH
jgi:hypothetical protein